MKVIISELLQNNLSYFPQIIFCTDMELRGKDGANIPYLNDFYDLLDQRILNMKKKVNLDLAMSWCISTGFWKKAIEEYKKNGDCDFIHQKDLDVDYIIQFFKETMDDPSWIELLKNENIEIIYDCPAPPSQTTG